LFFQNFKLFFPIQNVHSPLFTLTLTVLKGITTSTGNSSRTGAFLEIYLVVMEPVARAFEFPVYVVQTSAKTGRPSKSVLNLVRDELLVHIVILIRTVYLEVI
jgi:hypothetical protein